ncbi:hypothetical protein Tco_1165721 [Tanacetum coccineum]
MGVTRPNKYSELSPTEAIQADCDIKATNIILQGLPPEVYALVSNHKVAKELWERIQLLMQGTSLTKQEREFKLYDEFDKFAYKKGESLREFYLRFSLLLNDMNIYNMKLEQFQVNTKFLNTLPPEWSKFVTYVKLLRDLHTTNIDHLHAFLRQHEFHANEVRLMHKRNLDPLALVATHQMTQFPYQTHQNSHQNTQFQPQVSSYQSPQYGSPYQSQQYSTHQSLIPLSITYPSNDYQSSIHHNIYSPSSSIPQLEYPPLVNQQSVFSQQESGLIFPVFQKGDDPIDAINYMMSFLTAVGRQTSVAVGTSRTYTPEASGNNSGKQRTVIYYNCKGEGHMSKQCNKPKRKRDDSWLQAMPSSEQSNVVNHSETEITSDSNIIPYSQYLIESQQVAVQNSNSSTQQDDLILSVIEQLKTQVVHCTSCSMANISHYGSDALAESVEIDRLKKTLSEHLKEMESLMQTVTLLKNDFKKEESRNIDREIALEKKIKWYQSHGALDLGSTRTKVMKNMAGNPNVFVVGSYLQGRISGPVLYRKVYWQQGGYEFVLPHADIEHHTARGYRTEQKPKISSGKPKLYDGNVIKNTSAIVIPKSEDTLMLAEESRSKMLLKQQDPMVLEKKVNTTPVDYAILNQLSMILIKRFVHN